VLTSPSFAVGSATAHSPMPLANSVSPTGRVSSGPLIAVHRTRLHIHRRDDIVAAGGIKQQILEQIPPSSTLPQMVICIDDRQFGSRIGSLRRSSQSQRPGLDGPACCCAPLARGRRATEENGEFASVH